MRRKPIDQRATRTRAKLQQALKSLLAMKSYERISIDEICKLAKVSRSTFYAHFRSKDDLKRSGLEALRRELLARRPADKSNQMLDSSVLRSFAFDLFTHARDHLDHYRRLAGTRGATVIFRKLKETATDLVRSEFSAGGKLKNSQAVEREVAVQFVVSAFMGVLIWWLDRGATLGIDRIDALFQRFVREGVRI
jgi:AcrR family transcriptional regulator